MSRIASAWSFVKELRTALGRDGIFDLAAQFAYWALLAVFPFAIFLLTIIGYIPMHGIDQEVLSAMHRVMPEPAAQLFEHTLHEVVGRQRGGLLLVALIGALWSASGGMQSAMTALDRAYLVTETRAWWRRKVVCIAMTVGAAGLMIVATTALIIGPGVVHKLWAFFGLGGAFDTVWSFIRWPLVIVALMFALALLYYFLPNTKLRFRLISPGAVTAVLAWLGVSKLFGVYVHHFGAYAKTYGTLGAAMVLMTWLYLSGLWIAVGGEINAILDRASYDGSSTKVPTPSAR